MGSWGEITPCITTTGLVVALLKSSWGCSRQKFTHEPVAGSHHKQGRPPTGMSKKILARRLREIVFIVYMLPQLSRLHN